MLKYDIDQFLRQEYRAHQEAFDQIKYLFPKIDAIATEFHRCIKRGGKIFIAGNGGSAADAQHMAAEMIGCMTLKGRRALPVVALTTDSSILTAVANDFSYEDVFKRQLEGLAVSHDIFVGISTSGRSANIIKAMKTARSQGLKVVGLMGSHDSPMSGYCHHSLSVHGQTTPRIQEMHIFYIHCIVDVLDRFYLKA